MTKMSRLFVYQSMLGPAQCGLSSSSIRHYEPLGSPNLPLASRAAMHQIIRIDQCAQPTIIYDEQLSCDEMSQTLGAAPM